MLTSKFKINNTDKLYITDKYYTNGHWLVNRHWVDNDLRRDSCSKLFKKLGTHKSGTYTLGTSMGLSVETTPDIEAVIPKRDGYRLLKSITPIGVIFSNPDSFDIISYKFTSSEHVGENVFDIRSYKFTSSEYVGETVFDFAIDTKYVELLKLGSAFVKNATAPILILSGDCIDDTLIGVVMPMRI